jgi:non-ribosomal peptide synthetase component F
MQENFMTLLRSIVADPEVRLDALEILTEAEKAQASAEKKELEQSLTQNLMTARRKPVRFSDDTSGQGIKNI